MHSCCQCMNARAGIVHGKQSELKYMDSKIKCRDSVNQFFIAKGGTKELHSTIMTNGPVVSTSFHPSWKFLSNNSIEKSNNCHQDDILIVGWKTQPLSLFHDGGCLIQVVYVAIGQFGIDEYCLAPGSNFENCPWQRGPYYDIDNIDSTNSEKQWRTWNNAVSHANWILCSKRLV